MCVSIWAETEVHDGWTAYPFNPFQHSSIYQYCVQVSLLLLLLLTCLPSFLLACLPSFEPSSFIAGQHCHIFHTQSINRMDHHTGYFHDSYTPPSKGHSSSLSHIYPPSSSSSSAYSSSSDDDDDDTASTSSSYDSELLELQAAEREWEENVRQLQLAVSVLILPTIGKWLGRKWSYFCTFFLFSFSWKYGNYSSF